MKDSNGVITHFCFFPWEVPTAHHTNLWILGKNFLNIHFFSSKIMLSSLFNLSYASPYNLIFHTYSFKYTYIKIINIYASQNIKNNACSLHFGASALYVIGLRVISYENLITSEISWMLKRNSNIWFQTENSIFLLVGACDKASSKTSVYI